MHFWEGLIASVDSTGMAATNNDWVVLARIVRPQGRKGEVLADILTDFPESFAHRHRLFLTLGETSSDPASQEVTLESHWLHQGRIVLKFSGIDSINQAESLRNYFVTLPKSERMPVGEDTFYVSDLIGTQVIDISSGQPRVTGEVVDVVPENIGPAMLMLRTSAAEPALVPFVKAYLKKVDLQAKRIEMELPAGLLSAQEADFRENQLHTLGRRNTPASKKKRSSS